LSSRKVIENKKSSILKYLTILDRYKKYSRSEIEENLDIKGALERYLYLALQATIDMGEAVISYKGFRKPSTMTEIFHILNEEGMITRELLESLVKMVGFRNVIAHDYERVDYDIVMDALHHKLDDIVSFLKQISERLSL
jgi:uncharacterized protein YutE (UPF0331/DUF86 family)